VESIRDSNPDFISDIMSEVAGAGIFVFANYPALRYDCWLHFQ